MTLTLSLVFSSIALSLLTYFLGGYNLNWIYFYVPFLLAIAFFFALFGLFVLGLYLSSFLINVDKDHAPNKTVIGLVNEVAFLVCFLGRIKIRFTGANKLNWNEPMMIATNHLSNIDFVALFARTKGHPIISVGKKEIIKMPIVGRYLAKAGFLFIKQNSLTEGPAIIEKGADYLKEGICSVTIAPEGTRNRRYPEPLLLPFHPGSFALAKNSNRPIALLSFQNTNAVKARFPFRSTRVYIDVVDVIKPEQYKDQSLSEIAESCHAKMLSFLEDKKARNYHIGQAKEI